MTKRIVIFLTSFIISLGLLHSLEIVSTFEPLKPNERLAYQMSPNERGVYLTLNLYAQDIEYLYVTRLLGTWPNSTEFGILQFTGDRKNCFFVERKYIGDGWRSTTIYMLRGNAGTVVRLFENIPVFLQFPGMAD